MSQFVPNSKEAKEDLVETARRVSRQIIDDSERAVRAERRWNEQKIDLLKVYQKVVAGDHYKNDEKSKQYVENVHKIVVKLYYLNKDSDGMLKHFIKANLSVKTFANLLESLQINCDNLWPEYNSWVFRFQKANRIRQKMTGNHIAVQGYYLCLVFVLFLFDKYSLKFYNLFLFHK